MADTPLAAKACKLKRLKGLGEVFASGLMHEAFWLDFANRRQVGGAFGLTPWPWDSGDMHGDQPFSKVGNRRARTLAIECAWMWPSSARQRPGALVAKALCRRRQTGAPHRHRRPRPQADGGVVALSERGSGSRGRGARVAPAPRSGRRRPWTSSVPGWGCAA
ncbi:transposase [Mesorhizobium sp. M0587]